MDKIYLTGFMGSGKTTYGKQLAKQSGWYFLDTDKWLTQKHGKSISELFDLYGEQQFRYWEHELLQSTAILKNAIIATGGGMLAEIANMQFAKKNGCVVWLCTPLDKILSLSNVSKKRPLLALPLPELKKLFNSRIHIYEKSHIAVNDTKQPSFKSLYKTFANMQKDNFQKK